MPEVSRQAVVEKGAQLADDVKVGPFVYIGSCVRIGPGCVIDSGATVTGQTVIGAKCRIFPLAVVGSAPDGSDQMGTCTIGQANTIREHVTINAGCDEPTQIGDDNLIMIGCLVGAGARIASHCVLNNCTQINPGARIDDYVWTSAFTSVLPGGSVGAYTFLVGYTGVETDAPPFAMVQGYPFRVRGVNSERLRRCGFGDDDIRALKEAFRQLYNGSADQINEPALRKMQDRKDLNPHVVRLIEHIQAGLAKRQSK